MTYKIMATRGQSFQLAHCDSAEDAKAKYEDWKREGLDGVTVMSPEGTPVSKRRLDEIVQIRAAPRKTQAAA